MPDTTTYPLTMEELRKRFECLKFARLVKVDEQTHMAWGIATSETPDSEEEICDYEGVKADITRWSDDFFKRTTSAGQEASLGNIRVMHQLDLGGKAVKIEFHDDAKEVWLGASPADDSVWDKLRRGILTGYSIGGKYAWRKPEGKYQRYSPIISEISFVDNPSNPDATYAYVKADGSRELRKFITKPAAQTNKQEVRGVSMDATTLKSRIDAGRKDSKSHAAFAASIEKSLTDKSKAAFGKSLYGIANLASILQDLAYLRMSSIYESDMEDDPRDMELAAEIEAAINSLSDTLVNMVKEETSELTPTPAAKAATQSTQSTQSTQKGDSTMIESTQAAGTGTEVESEIQKAKTLKSHFTKMSAHYAKKAADNASMSEHCKAMADGCADPGKAVESEVVKTVAAPEPIAPTTVTPTPEPVITVPAQQTLPLGPVQKTETAPVVLPTPDSINGQHNTLVELLKTMNTSIAQLVELHKANSELIRGSAVSLVGLGASSTPIVVTPAIADPVIPNPIAKADDGDDIGLGLGLGLFKTRSNVHSDTLSSVKIAGLELIPRNGTDVHKSNVVDGTGLE